MLSRCISYAWSGALIIVLTISVASARQSDKALTRLLVGAWTFDREHPADEWERKAFELGILSITRYNVDGSGVTDVYRGALCSSHLNHYEFHWKIENGVLIASDHKRTLRDRIIEITYARAKFVSLDESNPAEEYRLRLNGEGCQQEG